MEHQIIQRLVQYLLLSGFPSKKAIAQQMGIPYRTLLNACDQESSLQIKAKATERIMRAKASTGCRKRDKQHTKWAGSIGPAYLFIVQKREKDVLWQKIC